MMFLAAQAAYSVNTGGVAVAVMVFLRRDSVSWCSEPGVQGARREGWERERGYLRRDSSGRNSSGVGSGRRCRSRGKSSRYIENRRCTQSRNS